MRGQQKMSNYQLQRQDLQVILHLVTNIEPMLQKKHYDRFIPVRNHRDFLHQPILSAGKRTEASTNYSRILSPESSKYLTFATPGKPKNESLTDFIFKSLMKNEKIIKNKQTRKAARILDAPDVINNFYYNPLDWAKHGTIGIALSESAYFLGEGKQVQEVDRCSNIPITCLKFYQDDTLCLIGQSTGRIQVYDCQRRMKVRQINVHYDRVGVLQDSDSPSTFLSASKDKIIKLNDLRIKKTDVAIMQKHKGQICGMSTTKHYLASGGNDNRVIIWDLRKNLPINQIKEHKSAIKAIAWCPWKTSLLATGGGSQDKRIILWNGNKNIIESRIDTQSQVIALDWKQETRQLISGHYSGKNSYCVVWSGVNVEIKLKGHEGRLLGMKMNSNSLNQLCTIASDQTLRFWDIKSSRNKQEYMKESKKREIEKQQEFDQGYFR